MYEQLDKCTFNPRYVQATRRLSRWGAAREEEDATEDALHTDDACCDEETGRHVHPTGMGPARKREQPMSTDTSCFACGHTESAHDECECWTYPDAIEHPDPKCPCHWYDLDDEQELTR